MWLLTRGLTTLPIRPRLVSPRGVVAVRRRPVVGQVEVRSVPGQGSAKRRSTKATERRRREATSVRTLRSRSAVKALRVRLGTLLRLRPFIARVILELASASCGTSGEVIVVTGAAKACRSSTWRSTSMEGAVVGPT